MTLRIMRNSNIQVRSGFRALWVQTWSLGFGIWSFGFVQDFELGISDFSVAGGIRSANPSTVSRRLLNSAMAALRSALRI
jgi:hypothetical protein